MKGLLALALLGAALVAAHPHSEPLRDVAGAQVIRAEIKTLSDLGYMKYLQSHTLLDFWTEPRKLGKIEIMARRWDLPMLKQTLRRRDIPFAVMIHNVADHLAEMNKRSEAARSKSTKMDWVAYHTLEEINSWMQQLTVDYPDIATLTDIGTSYEGRTMYMLKLSTGGVGKEAIFTDGGIHAREWISPATVTYFINELVTNDVDGLLNGVDFYFLPSINPDGYSFSWTDDRLWRKTRSVNAGSPCLGTDPNRNWDFHWMEGGASDLPCAETYAGPQPFSEVEMRNVRDQILAIQPRVYLTFHSYSQLWMYPWGYTPDLPENWVDLDNLAQSAVSALTAVYGTSYEIGSSTNTIYIAAGGSDDWALGVGGCEYAYTIELRDQGRYGFELPEEQIIESGIETYEGFKVVAQFIIDNPARK